MGEAGVKVCELRTSRYLNRARSHRGEGAVWEDHRRAEGPQVSDLGWRELSARVLRGYG